MLGSNGTFYERGKHMEKAEPMFWKEVLDEGPPRDIRLVAAQENEAHFVSSRLSDGKHILLLDLDCPVHLSGNELDVHEVYWPRRHNLAAEWTMLSLALKNAGIGEFVSSKRGDHIVFTHTPRLYASDNNFHLALDLPPDATLPWWQCRMLLRHLLQVKLIEYNWYHLCDKYEMCILIKPGVPKDVAYEARYELNGRPRKSLIYVQSPYGDDDHASRSRLGGGFFD